MPSLARACASWALKVLFPTPPFPDNTRILCLTLESFSPISAMAEMRRWQKQMIEVNYLKSITTPVMHLIVFIHFRDEVVFCHTRVRAFSGPRGTQLLVGTTLTWCSLSCVFTGSPRTVYEGIKTQYVCVYPHMSDWSNTHVSLGSRLYPLETAHFYFEGKLLSMFDNFSILLNADK